MLPLSVIITTYNEALHIEAAIRSIAWADEILVVDSHSTDDTRHLAANTEANVNVVSRNYVGPADQKNWALQQVKNEWVFILDADERVSPELAQEIQTLLSDSELLEDAYRIPRQNHFMGKRIRYSGWQNDSVVRLVRRSCRYNNKQVHEEIETTDLRLGNCQHPLVHYTFRNSAHFLAKMERYALWSAQDHQHTKQVTWFHLAFKPFFRFIKHFVLQRGFLDGKTGFVVSVIMAWGVFLRYLKMMEIKQEGSVRR